MSERSQLLKKVLETFENSDEGEAYLNWLLQPEAAQLDGGDVLREAVLDTLEEDEQLQALRRTRMAESLKEIFDDASFSESEMRSLEESSSNLLAAITKQSECVRLKADALGEIRRALNRDRLETLRIVSEVMSSGTANEIQQFFRKWQLAEDLAAKVASLSRTSVEVLDAEHEWRKISPSGPSFEDLEQTAKNSAGDWFDLVSERLDTYYSHQLVSQLEMIVQRGAALLPMKLSVKSDSVRLLFREAHDAYLYGFDASSIALCRSLIDQALRDKLALGKSERVNLATMIQTAEQKKLLDSTDVEEAKKVQKAGNSVVHDISKVPDLDRRVGEVLKSTRIVLEKLYS